MQEDIEHRSVTLIVNGAKFSGRMLKSAIRAYMGYRKEKHREHKAQKQAKGNVVPHGKMTVKQLAEQNQGMSSFEMQKDDGIKQFERVCRKYGVDYAVRQVKGDKPMSMKTRSAKYAKMRRGEYQSVICPYGYQKGANGKMEPNPETAPIVQQIFAWADEGCSGAEIARRLTLWHIPTPGEYRVANRNMNYPVDRVNGVWTVSRVLRILADERYTGMYIMCKKTVKEIGGKNSRRRDESEWIKIPGQHPAIVDTEQFRQVNEKRHHFTIPQKTPHDYLLKGKVVCGYCDHVLFRAGKGNHVHYNCRYSTKLPDMPCYGLSMRASELEQAVFCSVKSQLLLFLGNEEENDGHPLQSQQLAAYESRLLDLQTKKRRLYEQCISGCMDFEQMGAEKKKLDSEMASVTDSLTVLREMEKKHQDAAQVKRTFRDMLQEICEADQLTPSVADRLIDKVYIFHDKRIEIKFAMQDVWTHAGFCVNETQISEKMVD